MSRGAFSPATGAAAEGQDYQPSRVALRLGLAVARAASRRAEAERPVLRGAAV